MTAKEALYKLSGLARDKYPNSSVEPLCLTIETALNRLEELEKLVSSTLRMDKPAYERLLELEKVLKIIKEKKVAISILFIGDNVYVYNELYDTIIVPSKATPKYEYKLTETEFKLLKECLK